MERPLVISGRALIGEELELLPVDIIIERGVISAIEETKKAPDIWICPAFFNAHTHLGDTVAMDCAVSGDLVGLVTPPFGLKHMLLAAASYQDLVSGMRESIRLMIRNGTAGCADFREGGQKGVAMLREAVSGQSFRCVMLGREGGERDADGLGVSSARDVEDLDRIVSNARHLGRLVAFHAGEKDSGDIDAALAYDPDFIVHATHATHDQLRQCTDLGIPIIVCPRSNWTLLPAADPVHPPIQKMLDLGCVVFLGTDNVMFVQPDMTAEMAFVHTVYHIEPKKILRMAVAGSSIAGDSFFIRKGIRANLFSIDPRFSNLRYSRNPVTSIVKRAISGITGTNVFNA